MRIRNVKCFAYLKDTNSLLCWNGLYPPVTHHFASFCLLIICPPFSWWQFTNRPILQDLAYPSSLGQLGGWLFHVNLPSNHPHLRERRVLLPWNVPHWGTGPRCGFSGEAWRHAKRSLAQVLWYCGINQSDLTSFRTFEVANSAGMSKIRLWRQPGFVRPHSVDGSLKAKKAENFSNGYGPWVKFIGYLQTKKYINMRKKAQMWRGTRV